MNADESASFPRAAVMGWPVTHSLSPRLHGYWLKHYRIPGSYTALPVSSEDLPHALKRLLENGFRGVNLTVPHKEAALAIMDVIDPLARRIGAVNTVVVRSDGALEGRNTDVNGFKENLRQAGVGVARKPVTILGAGGAARAVVAALQEMAVAEIRLVNRSRRRAELLQAALGGAIALYGWDDTRRAMLDSALLVNATSLGMTGQPPLEVELDGLPSAAVVADIVYAPLMTGLLRQAEQRGHVIVDGLGMLLHQARPAFAAFFGKDPEVTPELRAAVLEGLA